MLRPFLLSLMTLLWEQPSWADVAVSPVVSAKEQAWQKSCIKHLKAASRRLGERGRASSWKSTAEVHGHGVFLFQTDPDPVWAVEIDESSDPTVEEPGWHSRGRRIFRKHRGKLAWISWGLRRTEDLRDKFYAAFRVAVDACFDDLSR
jgi:hypothetical protein